MNDLGTMHTERTPKPRWTKVRLIVVFVAAVTFMTLATGQVEPQQGLQGLQPVQGAPLGPTITNPDAFESILPLIEGYDKPIWSTWELEEGLSFRPNPLGQGYDVRLPSVDPEGLDVIRLSGVEQDEVQTSDVEVQPWQAELAPGIDEPHLNVPPGEWTILRDRDAVASGPIELGEEEHYFPERMFYLDEGLPPPFEPFLDQLDSEPQVREARFYIKIEQNPLPWLEDKEKYGANVIVGLDPAEGARQDVGRPLPPGISVQLLTEGAGVEIPEEEREVHLTELGEGKKVPVLASDHRVGTVKIIAHVPWDEADAQASGGRIATASVLPTLEQLDIRVDKDEALGFGLETVPFRVFRYAEDNNLFASEDPQSLSVSATGSNIHFPRSPRLEAGSSVAHGSLRAAGLGTASFQVMEGSVLSASAEVQFVWPWELLLFTALGGLGGAATRHGFRRSKSPLLLDLFVGIFVGLVVVAGVASGLVVLNVDIGANVATTGAGAFVLAGVGGYGGSAILDAVGLALGLLRQGRA